MPSGGFVLVGLGLGYNLSLKTSTDGQNWSAVSYPLGSTQVDYPSVAVASNGVIGIGYDSLTQLETGSGFSSVFSCNGGTTWTQQYQVTSTLNKIYGRLVAVGNTFYVLIADTTYAPTFQLDVYQFSASGCPSGGDLWSLTAVPNYYDGPNSASPEQYCNTTPGSQNYGDCGNIHYSVHIDARATPAGWAVLYPVGRSDNPDINNFNFCTQSGGCSTISYSTDLFAGGITTSPNGDMWLSMLTYSGAPSRNLPLQQIAIYCTAPGNCPANGSPGPMIDPTWWTYWAAGTNEAQNRCPGDACFSAGDYMRTAMSTSTRATLPFILGDFSYATKLMQSFIQDPATGLAPVPGLSVGPAMEFGSNTTYNGTLTSAQLARRTPTYGPSAVAGLK